ADVVEEQVGRVVVVLPGQERHDGDALVEEDPHGGTGVVWPLGVVQRKDRWVRDHLSTGRLDKVDELLADRIGDAVAAVHELADERERGVDVARRRGADHRNVMWSTHEKTSSSGYVIARRTGRFLGR